MPLLPPAPTTSSYIPPPPGNLKAVEGAAELQDLRHQEAACSRSPGKEPGGAPVLVCRRGRRSSRVRYSVCVCGGGAFHKRCSECLWQPDPPPPVVGTTKHPHMPPGTYSCASSVGGQQGQSWAGGGRWAGGGGGEPGRGFARDVASSPQSWLVAGPGHGVSAPLPRGVEARGQSQPARDAARAPSD